MREKKHGYNKPFCSKGKNKYKFGTGSTSFVFTALVTAVILTALGIMLLQQGRSLRKIDTGEDISLNLSSLLTAEGEVFSDFEDMATEILEDFRELLPEDTEENIWDFQLDFSYILNEIFSSVSTGGVVGCFSLLIGITMLFSLAEGSFLDSTSEAMTAGISAVLSMPLFTMLFNLSDTVTESISAGCDFFGGLIPVATAALALGGAVSVASAEAVGMSLALSFVSEVLLKNLLPIASLMLTLSLISSFDKRGLISGISGSIKGIFNFLIGIAGMLIPASLALQSGLGAAKDTMALRSMKYTMGSLLPGGVGSFMTGVLSGLISGASALSGAIGSVSAAMIIIMLLPPLIELLLYRLAFTVAVSVLDFTGVAIGKRIITGVRSALDAIILISVMSGVVFFLEIIIFARSAVSI